MNMVDEAPPTRRGGRGSRRELRSAINTTMLPALKRKLPLVEPMDEAQVERIDRASMDILEDVGVIFRDPQAIADWKSVGADVRDDDRVHLRELAPRNDWPAAGTVAGAQRSGAART